MQPKQAPRGVCFIKGDLYAFAISMQLAREIQLPGGYIAKSGALRYDIYII